MEPTVYNPQDPVSGFAAIPRNMTGIGTKMAAGGYRTHMHGWRGGGRGEGGWTPAFRFSDLSPTPGKWDAGMATMDHTPHGRGYESAL